jgi:uncharacterized protein
VVEEGEKAMSYHLRRMEREIKNEKELQTIIEKGKYGVVGLCRNNEPYVVALSYGYDKAQRALYFHCAQSGLKLDFIKANPQACMTIIKDDGFEEESCDYAYTSIVIRGRIEFVSDKDEIDRAIRLQINQLETKDPARFLAKLSKENKGYLNLQMLKLKIEEITGKARQKQGVST